MSNDLLSKVIINTVAVQMPAWAAPVVAMFNLSAQAMGHFSNHAGSGGCRASSVDEETLARALCLLYLISPPSQFSFC